MLLEAAALALGVAPAAADDRALEFDALMHRQPNGPSFDCKLARLTTVEQQICGDAALARLDLELNDAYGEDAFYSSDPLAVVAAQSAWLRRRNACETTACLRAIYVQRLAAVRGDQKAIDARREINDRSNRPFNASPAITRKLSQIAAGCVTVSEAVDAGDGRRSFVARTCSKCGPSDGAMLFHPEADSYRIILRVPECYVSNLFGGFQDRRSHGLRDARTFSRVASFGYVERFYEYDGQTYQLAFELDQIYAGNPAHQQVTLKRP